MPNRSNSNENSKFHDPEIELKNLTKLNCELAEIKRVIDDYKELQKVDNTLMK